MKKSDILLNKIRKNNYQGLPVTNLFVVIVQYWPLGQYMLKKFGWRSWFTFWYTKLCVSDEGGEYAITDYYLYRFLPSLLKKPAKIEIEHTTMCNKKCLFCAHTHWNEPKERMTFDQFKHVIDSINSLKWINMAGIGSNFLNKDFVKMIEYAREKHINVNFVDEFDFFDEDKARKVIELGINSIYVSFDAPTKDTYEKTKKGCDFDKTINNINILLDMKKKLNSPFPVIHFRLVISKLNYQEMPQYIEFINNFKNRGVRARVALTGLITYPGIEEYFISKDDIPEEILVETFENALKHNMNLYFSHAGNCLPEVSKCVRWTEPFILVNGDVISDCAILMQTKRADLKQYSFGNVFDNSFMDIWNSEKYRKFRRMVPNKKCKVPKSCLPCCAFSTKERADLFGVEE